VKRLIDEQRIHETVDRLAKQVAAEYEGRPLTILGVLTGSIVLLSDLIRRIDLPLRVGLIQASSYRGRTTTAGELTIIDDLLPDIAERDVLLVDDIFDTGHTMQALLQAVAKHEPRSVHSLVLLWKEGRQTVEMSPDYFGFRIPDEFVVGYGLDYDDDYRHLPYIAVLEPNDMET
jgi:hypoxanthine phosphoribosyltransferase